MYYMKVNKNFVHQVGDQPRLRISGVLLYCVTVWCLNGSLLYCVTVWCLNGSLLYCVTVWCCYCLVSERKSAVLCYCLVSERKSAVLCYCLVSERKIQDDFSLTLRKSPHIITDPHHTASHLT